MKAQLLKKSAKSVVYSFEGRWESELQRNHIKVFFRKRRPIELPENVYFYVGVPVKAIIGYAEISKIEAVNLEQAIALCGPGKITANELLNYIGREGRVNAIWIENIKIFDQYLGLEDLRDSANFNPPQSFSYVDAPLGVILSSGAEKGK